MLLFACQRIVYPFNCFQTSFETEKKKNVQNHMHAETCIQENNQEHHDMIFAGKKGSMDKAIKYRST